MRPGRASSGVEHPVTQVTAHILAVIHRRLDRWEEAEKLLKPTVEAARRGMGPNHPNALLFASSLGEVLLLAKKFEESAAVLRETIAARVATKLDTWNVFSDRAQLGAALAARGELADAEPWLRDGLAGLLEREKQMPVAQRRRIADARAQLVALYQASGKPDEAAKSRSGL